MKVLKLIILAIILLLMLLMGAAAPLAYIGLAIFVVGLYFVSQKKKGNVIIKKPSWVVALGVILFLTLGVSSVDTTDTAIENGTKVAETTTNNVTTEIAEAEKKDEAKTKAEEEAKAKAEEEAKTEVVQEEMAEVEQEAKANPKPTTTPKGVSASVTRVVDGDTIEVYMNGKEEEIRMLLIDTPETKHPSKPVEPFGPEASQFAKEVLEGKTVEIQIGTEERDKYGRVLAYVWVGETTYQEMVLEKGLAATAYLYNDLTMLDEFHQSQDIARNKGIGVWSIPGYAHVDHDHGYHYEEEPIENPEPAPSQGEAVENFENCTELRKVYPSGVSADHPAYQSKMDRDKDNYACEA